MNILFFDTETTGFVQDRLPPDHADQPHLVQIAAKMTDENGALVQQFALIVNPGITIPARTIEFHGITDAIAAAVGVAERTALGLFLFMVERADLVVAHNAKFDLGVMACVAAREGKSLPEIKSACTMEVATPVLNLPPSAKMQAAGMVKPKSPKLAECVQHLFDEPLDGAHDALVDVNACARVFFHLVEGGHFELRAAA